MKEWIEEDPENQVMVEDFRRATQTAFPEYWEELEGMAEGSGLKVEDLFLSNLRGEVQQFSDAMTTPLKSCTDVFVDARIHAGGEGFVGYGHNDDWGMDWKKPGYHFDYFIEVYEKVFLGVEKNLLNESSRRDGYKVAAIGLFFLCVCDLPEKELCSWCVVVVYGFILEDSKSLNTYLRQRGSSSRRFTIRDSWRVWISC